MLAHAARPGTFVWSWHPHLDVWVLVALLGGGYALALRRLGPRHAPGGVVATRRQVVLFSIAVAAIWASTDWPVHDLAEGRMFSVHMVQHTVLSIIVPPLLLLGTPPWLLRFLLRPVMPLVRVLVKPLVALVAFNLTIALTHWPAVVTLAVRSGPAHLAQHVALVGTAVLMWWPVVAPLPELGTMHPLAKMAYLFVQSLVPTVPASFLTLSDHPLYHAYEAFPKLWGLSAAGDQQLAGVVMKLGATALLWAVITAVFFRWAAREGVGVASAGRSPPATRGVSGGRAGVAATGAASEGGTCPTLEADDSVSASSPS